MSKQIDASGFWCIKHNPISKEGVFPYLGKSISDECIPDKVYYVYRPASTLQQSVPTWDNPPKPFINDHEMLGDGFMAVDKRPVQGVISNPVCEDGVLYGDIAVYSEDLKDAIENGKKELSLGYFCKYKKERGIFDGDTYDFVQYDMVGNHIALVDSGRCGNSVRVFDQKITMDGLDVDTKFMHVDKSKDSQNNDLTQKKEGVDMADVDKRELIRKIMAISAKADSDFQGGETEKVEAIAKLAEQLGYSKSETGADEDVEEEKAKDGCGKDEGENEPEEKKSEDSLSRVITRLRAIEDKLDEVLEKTEEKKSEDEGEEENKSEDEESEKSETEDTDEEEKKSETDEDTPEENKAEDSALLSFGQDSACEDEAIKEYLK